MRVSQRVETDGRGDVLNSFWSPALDPDPSRLIATYKLAYTYMKCMHKLQAVLYAKYDNIYTQHTTYSLTSYLNYIITYFLQVIIPYTCTYTTHHIIRDYQMGVLYQIPHNYDSFQPVECSLHRLLCSG